MLQIFVIKEEYLILFQDIDKKKVIDIRNENRSYVMI